MSLRYASSRVVIAGVALVTVILDQVSKLLVVSRLAYGQKVELLRFLDLERTSNSGIAFGLAGNVPAWLLALFAIVVVAVVILVGSRLKWKYSSLAIGLILGGALGNLIDRAIRGSVVDFISVPHWPTFNLADVAITVGVGLLLLGLLRSR